MKRWRVNKNPKLGDREKYVYIRNGKELWVKYDDYNDFDNYNYEVGNYFETSKLARDFIETEEYKKVYPNWKTIEDFSLEDMPWRLYEI